MLRVTMGSFGVAVVGIDGVLTGPSVAGVVVFVVLVTDVGMPVLVTEGAEVGLPGVAVVGVVTIGCCGGVGPPLVVGAVDKLVAAAVTAVLSSGLVVMNTVSVVRPLSLFGGSLVKTGPKVVVVVDVVVDLGGSVLAIVSLRSKVGVMEMDDRCPGATEGCVAAGSPHASPFH